MDRRSGPPQQPLSAEFLPPFAQGISLVLSRWPALQLAVKNEWGGKNPGQRLEQLASVLYSWFDQYRGPPDIEDLENRLDEFMVLSFNADIEDGSIEEVAEQLMILYEDCLQENYELIERLKRSNDADPPLTRRDSIHLRPNGACDGPNGRCCL